MDRPEQKKSGQQALPAFRGGRGPGGHGLGAPVQKAKDFSGTVKKLAKRISPYTFAVVIVVLFALGATVFTIVGPKILGTATTTIFEGSAVSSRPWLSCMCSAPSSCSAKALS